MADAKRAHEELTLEWNELRSAWKDSRTAWKDSAAAHFERELFSPLEAEIPAFLATLERLGQELQSALRELR